MRTILALTLLLTPVAIHAQAVELSGSVREASGAAVPGAAVAVTTVERNSERLAVTDDQGRYRVGGLSAGTYRVQVKVPGYAPVTGTARSSGGSAEFNATVRPN